VGPRSRTPLILLAAAGAIGTIVATVIVLTGDAPARELAPAPISAPAASGSASAAPAAPASASAAPAAPASASAAPAPAVGSPTVAATAVPGEAAPIAAEAPAPKRHKRAKKSRPSRSKRARATAEPSAPRLEVMFVGPNER